MNVYHIFEKFFKRKEKPNEEFEEEDTANEIVLTYELNDEPLSNEFQIKVSGDAYSKIERLVKNTLSGENFEIDVNDYTILMKTALAAELSEFVQEYRMVQDERLDIIIGTSDIPYLMPVGVDVIKLPKICLNRSIREVSKMLNKWPLVFKDERRRQVVSPIPFGVAVSVENMAGDNLYFVVGNLERVVELDNDLKCVKSILPTKISKSNIYKTIPASVFNIKIKYM